MHVAKAAMDPECRALELSRACVLGRFLCCYAVTRTYPSCNTEVFSGDACMRSFLLWVMLSVGWPWNSLHLFKKRKPHVTPEWQQRLPDFVKRLEEALYLNAASKV